MEIDYDQLLEEISQEMPHPVYVLSGSGPAWYYNDVRKTMVKVHRGSECFFCEEDPENKEKYIVQIGYDIFSIPRSELLEVGWN